MRAAAFGFAYALPAPPPAETIDPDQNAEVVSPPFVLIATP